MRERLWFLSMLFVRPELQGAGRRARPSWRGSRRADGEASFRSTATDSAQPISNALYAAEGIVPRVPLLNLIGLPAAARRVRAAARRASCRSPFDGHRRPAGRRRPSAARGRRSTRSIARSSAWRIPVDHRFLRQESRTGWLYHGPDGAVVGYGYATEAGRIGPVAVRDAELLAPILGHLSSAVTPRGAFALWLPGTADRAIVPALRAGFRLDQFPVLLCWDRPYADLARYLPISPGLP